MSSPMLNGGQSYDGEVEDAIHLVRYHRKPVMEVVAVMVHKLFSGLAHRNMQGSKRRASTLQRGPPDTDTGYYRALS